MNKIGIFKNWALGLMVLILSAVLFSCKAFDAPKFENFFENAGKLKEMYCSVSNTAMREYILTAIRERHPDYPEHGFCGVLYPPNLDQLIQKAPEPSNINAPFIKWHKDAIPA